MSLTTLEILEMVLIGIFMLVHVISNFYSAKCNCKLCSAVRSLLGSVQPVEEPVSADITSSAPSPDVLQLLEQVISLLKGGE